MPPATVPRRRWFRISLRGIMLVVLIVGGALGWKLHRVRTERQAVAVIRAAGGTVEYETVLRDFNGRPWSVGTPLGQAGPAWVRRWVGDDFFRPVAFVSVSKATSPEVGEAIGHLRGLITLRVECLNAWPDRVWNRLAGLAHLEEVSLTGPGVTDAALAALGENHALRIVLLSDVSASDAGLATLAQLPALEVLIVTSGPNLSDAGMARMLAASQSQTLKAISWNESPGPMSATIRALGAHHPQLQIIALDGQGLAWKQQAITDADLALIVQLPRLISLNLGRSQLSDASLAQLAPLGNLQWLAGNLGGITNGGMKSLGKLTSLRSLDLSRAKVNDGGLVDLAGLTNLTSLSLHDTLVTGTGLQHLAALRSLQTLDLSQTVVTAPGLADLVGLPALRSLNLGHTQLTDAGAAALVRCPALTRLTLSETNITDAALDALMPLVALKTLEVDSTQVTPVGIARFQDARPDVTITSTTPRNGRHF